MDDMDDSKKTDTPKPEHHGGKQPWAPSEDDLEKIEKLASQGLNLDQISRAIGICNSTLYAKKASNYPEIQDAIDAGRAKGIKEVTNALFEKAKKGDNVSMIFFLKNRDPENWMDVQNHRHGGHGGGPIETISKVIRVRSRKPDPKPE